MADRTIRTDDTVEAVVEEEATDEATGLKLDISFSVDNISGNSLTSRLCNC